MVPTWTPSGAGIETARLADGGLLVRAAGDAEGPVLHYTRAEVDAFVRGAKDGEFDDLAGCDAGSARP
ncbi:DUF397 domain-containing protein [Actinomycetospora sp. TBRC 11914]|uniref:DUF397 domain-containing protein n=1 Tax=Actinomycetospora sp. TBRC 11914 TaxID=2729387 RepID=UPI00145D4721|nr:DUF397 domain-containing protein [Actinomycetospora sp. TBRC 11914]NMO91143.1 DUF397 domain-containing protein [Actinomycetospora sp. TBRC 11914]